MTSYDYYQMQDDIMHYGILGMKWGVRRFQNPDGTLTELGLKRAAKENKLMSKVAHAEAKGNERKRIKFQRKLNEFEAKNAKIDEKIAKYDAKQHAKREKDFSDRKNANDASELTTDELIDRQKRLELERSYRQAMESARGEKEKSGAFSNWLKSNTGKIMGTAITTVAGAAVTYKMKELIGKRMGAMPSWDTQHDKFKYIFPPKK